MITDDLGKILHDKFTRGEPLSDEEQSQLTKWYEAQDNLESDILDTAWGKKNNDSLQSQIETALTQLTAITQRIQDVATENEALRQEITRLRHQLVDSSSLHHTI